MPLNPTCTFFFSLILFATPEIANRRCSQVLQGLVRLLKLIPDMGHRIAGLYGSNRFSCCRTSSGFTINAAFVMPLTPLLFHMKLLIKAAVQRLPPHKTSAWFSHLSEQRCWWTCNAVPQNGKKCLVQISVLSGSCTVTRPPFHTPTFSIRADQLVERGPLAPACQAQLCSIG